MKSCSERAEKRALCQAGQIECLELSSSRAYAPVIMQLTKQKSKPPQTKKSSARLGPRQLRRLADRMVASNDPAEVARLKAELERSFYGDLVHA